MNQPTPENPTVPEEAFPLKWKCPACGTANTDEIHGSPALLTCAVCKERFGFKLTLNRIQ